MRSVQTDEIARLDGLLNELGTETEAQCEVLREHLESARVYLVGLMPAEYAFSLKMAEEVLDCVSDQTLRTRIEDFIHERKSPVGKKDTGPCADERAAT